MENLTPYQQGYLDGLKEENGFKENEYDDNTIDALLANLDAGNYCYNTGFIEATENPVTLTLNAENKISL